MTLGKPHEEPKLGEAQDNNIGTPVDSVVEQMSATQRNSALILTFLPDKTSLDSATLHLRKQVIIIIEESFLRGITQALTQKHPEYASFANSEKDRLIKYLSIYKEERFSLYFEPGLIDHAILNFSSGDWHHANGVLRMMINFYNIMSVELPEELKSKSPRDTVPDYGIVIGDPDLPEF